MTATLSERALGRFAAVLFLLSGLGVGLSVPLRSASGLDMENLPWVSLSVVAVGAAVWCAPWDRWPRRALAALPLLALATAAAGNLLGPVDPYVYAIYFAPIFAWTGLALPRGSSVALLPFFAASYLGPLWLGGAGSAGTASVVVVGGVGLLLGEATAWLTAQLARAESEARRNSERMGQLCDTLLWISACSERNELAGIAARALRDLLDATAAAVLLPRSSRELVVEARIGWPGAVIDGELAEAATAATATATFPGAALDRLARRAALARVEAFSLRAGERGDGWLLLGWARDTEPAEEFRDELRQSLVLETALAFERLRQSEGLREDSLTDPLTGVGNRRRLDATLPTLKEGDVVAVVDLDHFKIVNDTHGHAAGDRVLRTLADFLRGSLRDVDAVFRVGGEEFVLLLRGAGDAGPGIVERLCAKWRDWAQATTFSAGCATHRGDRAPDETLAAADDALYAAKGNGRDRVEVEGPGA